MKLSKAGEALLIKLEDKRYKAYKDSAGVLTIGVGHTNGVYSGMEVTDAEITEFLIRDIEPIEKYLNRKLPNMPQNKFDALVLLIFNIGIHAFDKSKVKEKIIENQYQKYIADEWIQWRNSGGRFNRGLLLRRFKELELYYGN